MENQIYIQKTNPPYFILQNNIITPLSIPFPLKPLLFQRDEIIERILFQKYKERIPYPSILLFDIQPPSNYHELPFYFYSIQQDLYSHLPNHPFHDLWYPFLNQNQTNTPWYDMGKIIEESEEIWLNARNVLLVDFIMRLSLQKVKSKKIFYQQESQLHFIQSHYTKSIVWIFIKENEI